MASLFHSSTPHQGYVNHRLITLESDSEPDSDGETTTTTIKTATTTPLSPASLDPAVQRAIGLSLCLSGGAAITGRRRRSAGNAPWSSSPSHSSSSSSAGNNPIMRTSRVITIGGGGEGDARVSKRRGWGMRRMCVEQLYRFEEQAM